jgi:hypothetical protein
VSSGKILFSGKLKKQLLSLFDKFLQTGLLSWDILKIFGLDNRRKNTQTKLMMTFVYRSNDIFLWHTNKANGATGKN